MSKVNTAVEDNIFLRYTVIIVGMTIMHRYKWIFKTSTFTKWWCSGISTAINYLTDINVGIINIFN